MKISVDTVVRGAFIGKSIDAVKVFLEEMTFNNYHRSNERVAQKKSSSRYEVNDMTLLAGRADALAQQLDRVGNAPISDSFFELSI